MTLLPFKGMLRQRRSLPEPDEQTLTGLALVAAEAWEHGPAGWMIQLSFLHPPLGNAAPPPPRPEDIAIALDDGRTPAPLEVTATHWLVPGEELTVLAMLLAPLPAHRHLGRFVLRIRPGAGVEPAWSVAPFTVAVPAAAAERTTAPAIDYLTKDYDGFRKAMLDRMALRAPQWADRMAADFGISLVETMAYMADFLSYYQDAVATEAHLDTARQRKSVARHARLMGYRLNQGRASRVWACLRVVGQAVLPAGTRLIAHHDWKGLIRPASFTAADAADVPVFETLFDCTVDDRLWQMPLHDHGRADMVLPAGTTRAHLLAGKGVTAELLRAQAPFLTIEGARDPADQAAGRTLRHVVRVETVEEMHQPGRRGHVVLAVQWAAADALPFDLPVRLGPDSLPAMARGNTVLADFGYGGAETLPAVAPPDTPWRPALGKPNLIWSEPLPEDWRTSPAAILGVPSGEAFPAIELHESLPAVAPGAALPAAPLAWTVSSDLLVHGPCDRRFMVETEEDGSATLRFGDGAYGLRPAAPSVFTARYRTGLARQGGIGMDTIHAVLAPSEDFFQRHRRGFKVFNPLPSMGGETAETTEHARLAAPEIYKVRRTCVRLDDYTTMAETVDGVAEAAARLMEIGGRPLIDVVLRSPQRLPVDEQLLATVRRKLTEAALVGRDVRVRSAVPVPILVTVEARVLPGHPHDMVRAALARAFSGGLSGRDTQGFFHPSQLRLGRPVFASALLARALAVTGVADAWITRLTCLDARPADPAPPLLPLQFDQLPVADGEGGRAGRGAVAIVIRGDTP